MARKATDLLDVFRYGGGDDAEDQDRAAAAPRERKRKRRPASASPGGFQGLILSKRQLVLTGSAMLLLVVLSFVIGLSAGRPGGPETPAAQRSAGAALLMIRGTMPVLDPTTRKPVDPAEVQRYLEQQHHVPHKNLSVRVEDGRIVIDIGPFGTEARARAYLERTELDYARIHGADPFLRPRILPFRR